MLKTANANIKYKDSIFTALFSNEAVLLELYNAIKGTRYGRNAKIKINTLTDVLYMEQMNDISFTIEDKLVVLIEHQSTINNNMPLRLLLYIARVYEKIVENENLYKEKRITIPDPEFIVLYNGEKEQPDYQELKLSEAFAKMGNRLPSLELVAKVYNINKGRNKKIAQKSPYLNDYEIFVAKVREYGKSGLRPQEAVTKAVKDCIKQNVLKNFLKRNSSEVENMLLSEWNWDTAKKVWQEEAKEDAREEILSLFEKGLSLKEVKRRLGKKNKLAYK